jgi:hypothetical protein
MVASLPVLAIGRSRPRQVTTPRQPKASDRRMASTVCAEYETLLISTASIRSRQAIVRLGYGQMELFRVYKPTISFKSF